MLPFEEAFKLHLLEQFDHLTPDQRVGVERFLWDLYDAIYNMKIQEKIDIALSPYSKQEPVLDEDFYSRIEEEVEREMAQETIHVAEEIDLTAARGKLQELLDKPQI